MRPRFKTARLGLLILLVVAASVAAALPGSSAALTAKSSLSKLSKAGVERAATPAAPPRLKAAGFGLTLPTALLRRFSSDDAISTFASGGAGCGSASSSFNLGATVCAQVSGPVSASRLLRRIQLVNPSGFVVDSIDLTLSPQTVTFTLPTATTDEFVGFIGPVTVDNRGTWRINLVDTSDASVSLSAPIIVHDPARAVADLQINKFLTGDSDPTAGSNIQSVIWVFNFGPDAAQNVRITDPTPANTTFQSLTQTDGPTFTCTTPAANATGTSTCTISSLANGAVAGFVATYKVNATIPNNTDLSTTASVATDTDERVSAINTSTQDVPASNPTTGTCTIGCPANITQDSDPGQAGAIVTYDAPNASSECGSVTTSHPSGSFFPIGTTVVTASTASGPSCSFSVTVIDKRAVTVTLNGAADVTVECHTSYTDAGASAVDTNNQPLNVTTTITIPSGQEDANGDPINPVTVPAVDPNSPNEYTITYTASDADGHTGKAVRIVHVIDTTPPVITLSGVSGFTPQTETVTVTNDDGTTSQVTETVLVGTVECSDTLTPPTATAFDGCDNHSVPVTASGAADTGTPGTYEIIFRASDAAGNDAEQRVRVTVVDTTAPVITINGANPMTVECHTSYTELGASAVDSCEGPVSVSISGSVDPNTVGPYTITYTASDSGGRTRTATRTVNVVDTTPPVVTLNGASSVTVECHTSYTDAGASATDSCSPTTSLSSTSDVNVNAPGTYHVIWSATDPSNNTGTATRTVVVVDTTPPVITLNSFAPSLWPADHQYQTFSVTQFVTDASDSCNTALGVGNVVIEKVTSDEVENGTGDGNTTDDIVIASNCKSFQVRAERQGGGNGRVYTVTFKVSDGYNVTRATAYVVVPHNPGETPVNSGVNYTVNGSCP